MAWRLVVAGRLAAALCLLSGCAARGQPVENVYYGLLHAHTRFSDGSGTPTEAFAMARAAGLHFFAVTEHNHAKAEIGAQDRTDGILIANDTALYDSSSNLTIVVNGHNQQVISVQRAAREATDATFVAIYGQEFSTISSGNHVNVLAYPTVLTDPDGDFKSLFGTLGAFAQAGNGRCVVQLNHPDVHEDLFYAGHTQKIKDRMFNDYGFDDHGGDFAALVAAEDPFVRLVEILSGPAMAQGPQTHLQYSDQHEADYYYYLVQGFHVSPAAGQDNHYKTWGVSSPARMGVLAPALTHDALLEAMRLNRTFATEDKNLVVRLRVNGASMGECLELAPGSDLTATVEIADADEPSAEYEATLVVGRVAPQTQQALEEVRPRDNEVDTQTRLGNGAVAFTPMTSAGTPEFVYARVKQGDGDRAWTAPVWINHPRPDGGAAEVWVWTKSASSHVYHHAWCTAAESISATNKMTGTVPPAGRTLHNCTHPVQPPGH